MYVRIDRARCVTPFTVERHSLVICMPAKCQSTRGICEIVTQCVDGRGQERRAALCRSGIGDHIAVPGCNEDGCR
jgi:hypothetical protein